MTSPSKLQEALDVVLNELLPFLVDADHHVDEGVLGRLLLDPQLSVNLYARNMGQALMLRRAQRMLVRYQVGTPPDESLRRMRIRRVVENGWLRDEVVADLLEDSTLRGRVVDQLKRRFRAEVKEEVRRELRNESVRKKKP